MDAPQPTSTTVLSGLPQKTTSRRTELWIAVRNICPPGEAPRSRAEWEQEVSIVAQEQASDLNLDHWPVAEKWPKFPFVDRHLRKGAPRYACASMAVVLYWAGLYKKRIDAGLADRGGSLWYRLALVMVYHAKYSGTHKRHSKLTGGQTADDEATNDKVGGIGFYMRALPVGMDHSDGPPLAKLERQYEQTVQDPMTGTQHAPNDHSTPDHGEPEHWINEQDDDDQPSFYAAAAAMEEKQDRGPPLPAIQGDTQHQQSLLLDVAACWLETMKALLQDKDNDNVMLPQHLLAENRCVLTGCERVIRQLVNIGQFLENPPWRGIHAADARCTNGGKSLPPGATATCPKPWAIARSFPVLAQGLNEVDFLEVLVVVCHIWDLLSRLLREQTATHRQGHWSLLYTRMAQVGALALHCSDDPTATMASFLVACDKVYYHIANGSEGSRHNWKTKSQWSPDEAWLARPRSAAASSKRSRNRPPRHNARDRDRDRDRDSDKKGSSRSNWRRATPG
jgi:hypothetical protein